MSNGFCFLFVAVGSSCWFYVAVNIVLCHTTWLHFFADPSYFFWSPSLSNQFYTGHLRTFFLGALFDFPKTRYRHFGLEIVTGLYSGEKVVLFVCSPCSPLAVTVGPTSKLIFPYRCYHTHVNIWKTLWITHTHRRYKDTQHILDLLTTMNETSTSFPLHVTVTIMLYV